MQPFKHYIDGAFEEAVETFESLDPSTSQPWARIPKAPVVDVDQAVAGADHRRAAGDPQVRVPGLLAILDHARRCRRSEGREERRDGEYRQDTHRKLPRLVPSPGRA